MDASRSGTAEVTPTTAANKGGEYGWQRLAAAVSILGALSASSCCILPLLLFSLGIGGAWIGNLTALAPYKPWFVAGTAAVLSYGFYLVYGKSERICPDGAACARPIPNRFVKLALWFSTLLAALALAFDYVAPALLGA